MKRRGDADLDSLELMLDTVCNMFGTIMFVALIAALLALTSRRVASEEEIQVIVSERDIERERLVRLEHELTARLAAAPAPEVDAEAEQAVEQVQKAMTEIERREKIIADYRRALEKVTDGLQQIDADAEPLKVEIERLDAAIAAAERAKMRKLRTPLEREMKLTLYMIVVWQGRMYPICDWNTRSPDPCERLVQWHARYTRPEGCGSRGQCGASGIDLTRRVQLREGRGIPIGDLAAMRADPEVRALLSSLDPERDLVGFSVARDSFEHVAVIKELFLSAGFNYALSIDTSPLPRYEDHWVDGIPRGL